jgi:nicotinamide riboside kinase
MEMKIALTGSSSVGKTTLVHSLTRLKRFNASIPNAVTADARALLRESGFHGMDAMTQEQTRAFQRRYFLRKRDSEAELTEFISERSFVDVAAYWMERDSNDASTTIDNFVEECRLQSLKYDWHFYLPFGLFPFESDGYRSEDLDFHRRIDWRIRELLREWRLVTVTLDTPIHSERVATVLRTIGCE